MGKLVRKPKGKFTPEKQLAHEQAIGRKARQIVTKVVLPGERYLVRWGGTRKGSGAFYTRPGLAIPTVQRTLRPLAYETPIGADGMPDRMAPPAAWKPKRPEEILALRVCDPACGSGTFPVAALRFLTDALYQSLHVHGRITSDGERGIVRLLEGPPAVAIEPTERLGDELQPCRPEDPLFEPRLKAILRRHVVERCIYGVDLDPLAVELCRLALWIETMDRTLPFSFLDHKIKCGNGLVGAWFDQFQHYPVMAWKNREGGDKSHANGVHFEKEARTKAIKAFVKELATDLADVVRGQVRLYTPAGISPADALAKARGTLAAMHDLSVHDSDERARLYRDEFLASDSYRSLRRAMDLWCACWFWPADELAVAPLPSTFASPPQPTADVVERVAARKRFFHWELEFPDVFRETGAGFDAVLGNPPWDIAKPSSKEFFSNVDPLYRSYGKQEALGKQHDYFADEARTAADGSTAGKRTEAQWLDYSGDFRAQSNFTSYAANAYGDPDANEDGSDRFTLSKKRDGNVELHDKWRRIRQSSVGFADAAHSFRHQGSADLNLYKLFLEQAHVLLRNGGRLGFIVPSGLYSDHGTGALRRLFLDRCRWEWLFGFENREKVFEIDSRFKFNPIVIEKGGTTEAIQTAFMRRKLEDWERSESLATPYTRVQVDQFSPRSKAILEIQSKRDLEILEKIYANSVLLGDDGPNGWGIKYSTEFHMTNDSKLFPPRTKWEEQGYRPDEYSRWLKGDWRPITELWAELGVQQLAAGERQCAQPPYDTLPIPRADIPAGIILSRAADTWIREAAIADVEFTDASGKPLVIKIGRGKKAIELKVRGPAIGLPLYEGRMIGQFDFSQKGWVSGSGRAAVWRDIPPDNKVLEPQFIMGIRTAELAELATYLEQVKETEGDDAFDGELFRLVTGVDQITFARSAHPRVSFMDVTSATNTRTMIASVTPPMPNGNKVPLFLLESASQELLCVMLNSIVFDYVMRRRMCGLSVNYFIIEEAPLPPRISLGNSRFLSDARALCYGHPIFASGWSSSESRVNTHSWRSTWRISPSEQVRQRAIVDSVAAALFGASDEVLNSILSGCDLPRGSANGESKGFWRVDKDKDPELRHTVLTLVAFHDLQEKIAACGGDRDRGIEVFLSQNDGEGWLLPGTLRLADYGLGHDERAKEHQPVAIRLGPRFHDWQLAQSPEESWRECHLHARNLLGDADYRRLLAGLGRGGSASDPQPNGSRLSASTRANGAQQQLFK
ncbi:MAG: hypothetical protein IPH13_10145 [Planctomycetes bacterium]|nr:hypothetical protein [Planctomycetota bacterium]